MPKGAKKGKSRGKLRMLWDLSRESIVIPKNPTLQKTAAKLAPQVVTTTRRSVGKQIDRALSKQMRKA